MKKLILIVGTIIISQNHVRADLIDDIKKFIRPPMEKYLGQKISDDFLGPLPGQIILPQIPQLESDAKSTKTYKKRSVKKLNISKEKEEKLNYLFLKELFQVVRNIKPDENDIMPWLNTLNQGATREGIYRAIVLDGYYVDLENINRPIQTNLKEFSIYFFEKYFNLSMPQSTLKKINGYTLKRVITSKSLDLIDVYKDTSEEDLYNWYAVLSSDLAQRFPNIWKSKIRGNDDKMTHKTWASKVPIQHIKSEVLIKIHSIINSML